MAKYRYYLDPVPRFMVEDLPALPPELRDLYLGDIKDALRKRPDKPKGFGHHFLYGDLKGYLALEVEWENDPNAYRLVYKILNNPPPRRVKIISFAKHNLAYDSAMERVEEYRAQMKAKKRKR